MDIPIKSLAIGGRIPRIYNVVSLVPLLEREFHYTGKGRPKSLKIKESYIPIPSYISKRAVAKDLRSVGIVKMGTLENDARRLFFPLSLFLGLSTKTLLEKLKGHEAFKLRADESPLDIRSLIVGRLFGLDRSVLKDPKNADITLGAFNLEDGDSPIFKSRYCIGRNGEEIHNQAVKTLDTLSDMQLSWLVLVNKTRESNEDKIIKTVLREMVTNFNREKAVFDDMCERIRRGISFPLVLDGLDFTGRNLVGLNLDHTSLRGTVGLDYKRSI